MVLERLKAQASQKSEPKKEIPKEVKVEEPEEDDEDAEEDVGIEELKAIASKTSKPVETPKEIEKAPVMPEDVKREAFIGILQNNGIYRLELLSQLEQVNRSLYQLASLFTKLLGEEDANKQ